MVDVLCLCQSVVNLRNLGVLGHLVDLADHRDVHQIADELRLRGFRRLSHSRRLRDLSLYRNKHGNNLGLFGSTFRDALLVNVFDDSHYLFANLRHLHITSVFDNTPRNALLGNDLRDFQSSFLDLRHWYSVDLFDSTLRDALRRNNIRDFHNLVLNLGNGHVLDELPLRDVLLGNDRDCVFHDMRHWHIHRPLDV